MTTNGTIAPELLDQLLGNYTNPEDLLGEGGLFKQLKKALIERALGGELTEHLGYEKGDPAGRGSGNNRNGVSSKTVLSGEGDRSGNSGVGSAAVTIRSCKDPLAKPGSRRKVLCIRACL